MKPKIIEKISFVILIFTGILFLFPLVVTFTNSFMTELEISLNYTTKLSFFDLYAGIKEKMIDMNLIPMEATLGQYYDTLVNQPTFILLLINSLKITLPVVLGNVVISLLTAYGFTIWKWKYKDIIFLVYIIVMLMPLQAVLVPNYIIADQLNIKESYLAIILPGIFSPFGTFLLNQSMKAIPNEYFEAASVDGANPVYIFFHIVIPQMKSGIAALIMLTFIEYWNLVEQAVIFIKDYYLEPLSVYLSRIAEGKVGIIFAASCIYMFLPLWFLLMGQENLEKGIELSGMK
ncbi:ABC transporter permease subunit [Anaerocolumna sedimenticola]|uniref:ABC transporter permease subunit n=1 Tax=Anaerocolumna sedimenticola TaxID=2696063 RepID=A0A6P1TPT0_9FIRM|nr:carbohydrate ABC transporter permease [Anaerocolumna sedimenticola]QHQ61901.1 ABC transporter permease subunit [Anaerocolumna sedimenticola]